MFRMVIGLAALTAMVVALTSGNHVSGQDKRGGAPVNKGAVKGGMGGAIDVEALFRKHAGKDGTLTLEGFKKLLVELDGQQIVIGEPAKVADPGRPIIKGGGNK